MKIKNNISNKYTGSSSDPKLLDYSKHEYYTQTTTINYLSKNCQFNTIATLKLKNSEEFEKIKLSTIFESLFRMHYKQINMIFWHIEPENIEELLQNISLKKINNISLILTLYIDCKLPIKLNFGKSWIVSPSTTNTIEERIGYLNYINHIKNLFQPEIKEIWGIYPKIKELDKKIELLIKSLQDGDITAENEKFHLKKLTIATEQNQYVGINEKYNIIKKLISNKEKELFKLNAEPNENMFMLLVRQLKNPVSNLWRKSFKENLEKMYKKNTYNCLNKLQQYKLAKDEIVNYYMILFSHQDKEKNGQENKVLLEAQKQFILSAREYYLMHVARHLGELNAKFRADQYKTYSRFIFSLYHEILKNHNLYSELKQSFLYLKFFNSLPDLSTELVGFPLLAFFDDYFKDGISKKILQKKDENDEIINSVYYTVLRNEKIFKELTEADFEKIALRDFKASPTLSPPPQWIKDGNSDNLEDNYTGGINLNDKYSLVSLLNIKEWYNPHTVKMYNPRILEAINMSQSCGFIINLKHFKWFFTKDNPEFISEAIFQQAIQKTKEIKEKEQINVREKKENLIKYNFNLSEISKITSKNRRLNTKDKIFLSKLRKENKELEKMIKANYIDARNETEENYQENNSKISAYYSQNTMLKDLTLLQLRYQEICFKINGENSFFPFPEQPIIYFPTGIDFRLRQASRSGIHALNDSHIRNFLESPWKYVMDKVNFIQSLITRYVPKALSLKESKEKYEELFSKYLSEKEITYLVKTANDPVAFHVAIIENNRLIRNGRDKPFLTRYLMQVDATASAIQLQNMLCGNVYYKRDLNFQQLDPEEAPGNIYHTLFLLYYKEIKNEFDKLTEEDIASINKDKIKVLNNKKNKKIQLEIKLHENTPEIKEVENSLKISHKYFIYQVYTLLNNLEKDNFIEFQTVILKIAKTIIMQGSYGGTIHGFLEKLNPIFNQKRIFIDADQFLRFPFLQHFWDFLLFKTSCFTYLKMCKLIAETYQKFSLYMTFNSLSGCFITIAYNKIDSIQVYRKIMPAFSHQPVLHRLYAPKGDAIYNKSKNKTSFSANFIQHIDAFIIHRIFSRLRDFYVPGLGIPILPIHDSLTLPIILLPITLAIYRDVNYDVFCNKGFQQDFKENYSNLFFHNNNKSLLETYFEHFIDDLILQVGNTEDGKQAIEKLKDNLEKCTAEMIQSKDFIPFDYQLLKDAMFVKKL